MSNQTCAVNKEKASTVRDLADDESIWLEAPNGMSVKVSITNGVIYADIWRDEAYLDDAPVATCSAELSTDCQIAEDE